MGQNGPPTNASRARTGRDKVEKKKETTTAEFRQRRSPSKEIRADLKKNPLKHVLALFVREKQRRQDEGGAIGSSVPSWKYKNINSKERITADTEKKRTRKYKPQTTKQKDKHKGLKMAPMPRRSGKPKDNNKPVWV